MVGDAVVTDYLKAVDGGKIAFRHYMNNDDKVIVIVHGFYNSKDSVLLRKLADELSKKYSVFMYDLRGHGNSSGSFAWTSKEGGDLEFVLNYLKQKYSKIAVIGFSLGGSISINTLSKPENKADSLICVSAPSDTSKVDYKWWALDPENDIFYTLLTSEGRKGKGVRWGPFWLKKEKPVDNIGKINIPVLFIHGDKDWVIGSWHSKALFEKTTAPKKLVIIGGGPHAEYLLRKHSSGILDEINSWLENTI